MLEVHRKSHGDVERSICFTGRAHFVLKENH